MFLLFFIKKKDKNSQVLFYFFIFVLAHQIIYNSLVNRGINLANLFNLFYTPAEFFFTALYLKLSLYNKNYKKTIDYLTIIFFSSWIVFLIISGSEQNLSYIRAFAYSLIIFFCIAYYFEQMNDPRTVFIYRERAFWAVSGFFLFAAGTFFIFLYDQFSTHVEGFLQQYVYIHALFFIIRNLFFSVSLFINRNKLIMKNVSLSP